MNAKTMNVTEYSLEDSWDAMWMSQWFKRDTWRGDFREHEDIALLAQLAESVMPKDEVRSVLDCTCGLGCKSIVFAEMGYRVDASDGSAEAVKITHDFSREEGVEISCFQSRWEELGRTSKRTYDCVFNDAFDLAATREDLLASAKGIFSVLRDGGRFIFPGAHQWFTEQEKQDVLDIDWHGLRRIEVDPPYERDGLRLTGVVVHDRSPEGIVVNGILIWDQDGHTRVEIIKDWIRCFRWTWQDYIDVLSEAGFMRIYSVKLDGYPERAPYITNVAVR